MPCRLVLPSLLMFCFIAWPVKATDVAFFEKKIRPVLVEHCFQCHSTKSEKLKGNLRLDSRTALLQGGDSGPAIVPGAPEQSLLIRAIRYQDEEMQMPPKGRLPQSVIDDLTAWVKGGAPWPQEVAQGGELQRSSASGPDYERLKREHWAYQPVRNVAIPAVKDASWPRSAVDRFILAKLEARALAPAADALPRTLIRRIYYDLIGLPPSPHEVDAFVKDPSPRALQEMIDRLMASPHFGERWGRHWLDVARYSDSTGGSRSQLLPNAWRYRDYVVHSFNRDKPFDQFIREQIAGDHLPASNDEQRREYLVALGFLAIGPKNLDAQDKDLLRNDVVDEQIEAIGRAFLGQTLSCARCHDHKFDPIPTRDYYALAGILRSTKTLTPGNVSGWVERALPGLDEHAEHRLAYESSLRKLQAQLDNAKQQLAQIQRATGTKVADATLAGKRIIDPASLAGIVVDDAEAQATGSWKHSTVNPVFVGSGYVHDEMTGKGQKQLTFTPEIPKTGEYEVRLAYAPGGNRAARVPVRITHAGDERVTTVHVDTSRNAGPDEIWISLGRFTFDAGRGGSVSVSNVGTTGFVTVDAVVFVPADSKMIAKVSAASQAASTQPTAMIVERVRKLEAALAALKKSAPPPAPTALAVQDEEKVEDYRICIRGSNHNLGPVVPRGFISAASAGPTPAIASGRSGRNELAVWLTNPANPLTARVATNRIWHHLFGHGLVRTPDDFGTTGETPAHPELLDHLARTFIADGWSTKRMIRRLMLSRVYQLGSVAEAQAVQSDPENRLLSRFNRRRLDAECIRDTILAISGQLDLTPGGPTLNGNDEFHYVFEENRRSVYLPVLRYNLHEMLEVFDFADPNLVVGRRNVSTLSTQALFLMNSPFVMEQARLAAQRLLQKNALDDTARIGLAYETVLGRPPTARERAIALGYVVDGRGSLEAWSRLYQVLFASLDFRYLD